MARCAFSPENSNIKQITVKSIMHNMSARNAFRSQSDRRSSRACRFRGLRRYFHRAALGKPPWLAGGDLIELSTGTSSRRRFECSAIREKEVATGLEIALMAEPRRWKTRWQQDQCTGVGGWSKKEGRGRWKTSGRREREGIEQRDSSGIPMAKWLSYLNGSAASH